MWDKILTTLAIIVCGACGAVGVTREVTDEEYSQFPRLFHLDDYDSCMLKANALFCLGTFEILPDANPVYHLLKEYSDDVKNFNRTRLHRGYCVSERCPLARTENCNSQNVFSNNSHCHSEENLTSERRFERCVARWSQKHGFRVRLTALQSCHTRQDVSKQWEMDTPQLVFLAVVALIVIMNVLGTLYDVTWSGHKSKILISWSVRSNWRYMVRDVNQGVNHPLFASLFSVEAARTTLMLLILLTHAGCIQDMLYLVNPRLVDQVSHEPIINFLYNGHSAMQIFFLLSSFLVAQKILKQPQPSFWILPKMLIKRIVRISPVYLVVLGFAATWWPVAGGGPQWAALVAAESATCRGQFWPLAFFLGNYVKRDRYCLIPTWYLQVDMQLYFLAILLTVCLARLRRVLALQLLGGMFVLSVVGTAALAYARRLEPLVVTIGPDLIRSGFSDSQVFASFYTQPASNVGATLAGLFLALLLNELRVRGFQPGDHKALVHASRAAGALVPLWTGGAGPLWAARSRGACAAFLALERPVITVLYAAFVFGVHVTHTEKVPPTRTCKSQKSNTIGLPLGRVSLAIMLLHWPVNLTLAASRAALYHTSALQMVVDFLATVCLSYMVAVPVTLLVDMPAQQMFAALTR